MNEPSNFCEWPCDNPFSETESNTDIVPTRRQLAPRQEVGTKKGLLNRNLLDPSYKIKNTFGVLSNKTARTDLIHQGGWTEYDTHNLYVDFSHSRHKTDVVSDTAR